MPGREPQYIRAFKESTKRDPTPEDLEQVEAEIYSSSDRHAVIVLVSLLEAAFGAFIRKMLRSDISSDDKRTLFDFHGPLGTFSSQIAIAHGFGIVGHLTRHDLELIRIVRNAAAHSRVDFSFDMPELARLCEQLKLPDQSEKAISVAYVEKFTGEPCKIGTKFEDNSPRTRFHTSVGTVYVSLVRPREEKRVAMLIPFYLP